MKTISKDNEILRVDEETATLKVKAGWEFVPKSEWKKTRPTKKIEEPQKTSEKEKIKKVAK